MKRSAQEILELAAFALIALVVGVLLVWGLGWAFTGLGWLLRLIASFVWALLRFVIPIAIVAGVIYLVVKLLSTPKRRVGSSPAESAQPPRAPMTAAPAPSSREEPAVPADLRAASSGFETDPLAERLADERADDPPQGDERRQG